MEQEQYQPPSFRASVPSDYSRNHFGKLIKLHQDQKEGNVISLLSWDKDGNLMID